MAFSSAFTLPPVLLDWPWERRINPHHVLTKQHSDAWFESFHAFEPAELKAFIDCDFALFSSMIYSFVNKDHLRTGQDLMNLFFLFDEYTDVRDGSETSHLRDVVMDALRHPHAQHRDPYSVVGRFTQQFWARAIQTASKSCQRVFLSTFEDYVTSVIKEAADRVDGIMLNVDDYMVHRRDTAGSYPTFAMLLLDMEIPAYALNHPLVDRLTVLAGDMIILLNDMYSYYRELGRGLAGHNLVTVVMHQYGIDLNSALKWVADRQIATEREFLLLRSQLPKWDDEQVNIDIERYVEGLGYTIRGLECWSFVSTRYFGSRGLSIQKSRVVQLGSVKDEWNWEINTKL